MTSRYRPDIDGLRAVSILLVVVFHAFPDWLPGGYLGVDVFFVISGFLITDLVMRGAARGRFGLGDFYARRVRRLFPALVTVTAACLALGWFALLPGEYAQLGRHALAASLFVPNLVFWSEAGYWDTASRLKPLLHLWSLGVEEQFYLVWPALLLLFGRLRLPLPAWVLPVAAISFAANLSAAAGDPAAAFFLPQFRIWELMLGGLLAHRILHHRDASGPPTHAGDARADTATGRRFLPASVQSAAGLAMIVAAAALFEGETKHSALPVLMPALGTLLVIDAGAAGAVNRVMLGNRGMVLLGKVSYPLYLWHWPALSFLAIVESGTEPWTWKLGAVVASFVLAWLTWRFVEIPVRRLSGWRAVAPLAALSVATGALGGLVYRHGGFPHRTQHLASQLEAFEWESTGLFERDDCSASLGVPGRCLSNGRPHSVAVVGDSYSTNVFLILQELHRDDGVGVMRLGRAGCLPLFGVERYLGSAGQGCRDAMDRNLAYLLEDKAITTVVLSLRESLYLGRAGGNRLELAGDAPARSPFEVFRRALELTVARFIAAGKDVVYAFGWPELSFDPKACVDVRPLRLRPYEQAACTMDRRGVDARSADYRRMVLDVLAGFPRTSYWDPCRVLCDDLACYSKRDGVMLYRDNRHLSLAGCEYLGRDFILEPVAGDGR